MLSFEVESDFTEQDELWQPNDRETAQEHVVRVKELLDDIFNSEQRSVISFTTHSGTIRALYAVTGHRASFGSSRTAGNRDKERNLSLEI